MNIKFENVNYIYNPGTVEAVTALENINLEIGGDCFIAVVGSTGSGKSTMIQMLNGLKKPSSGRVLFDGSEIFGDKNEKKLLRALRCEIGFTFQYPENQLFATTVYADVAYGPKNLGCSRDEIDRRVKKALDAVRIPEIYFEKSPFELSGGEMRRVAIAGMLAMEPKMLILDEPTAGLDPAGKIEMMTMIKEIQQSQHITVVLVSHSMEQVAKFADRVIALDKAHIVYDLPTKEFFKHYREIEKIGLKAPEVRYFMEKLSEAGFDIDPEQLTIEEAKNEILKAFGR